MPPKYGILRKTPPPTLNRPLGNKIIRIRASHERPWDNEVEFGSGIPGHGTSTNPKTVSNRSNRTVLKGPPLALARLKDTLRPEKSRAQRAGITTQEAANVVKRPIGIAWSELSNTEQGKYKEILNEYMTIQLCRRNIYILNKWNALDEDNQCRLLSLGAHEPIPSFEMSQEDI